MLFKNNVIKIGDLGAGKDISQIKKLSMKEMTVQTKICSQFYASPEFFSHAKMDQRADVWALGCIIHELCCLKETFSE